MFMPRSILRSNLYLPGRTARCVVWLGTTCLSLWLIGSSSQKAQAQKIWLTNIYTFQGADGAFPSTSLIQAKDGAIYGITPYGGPGFSVHSGNLRFGTVFKRSSYGFSTLYTFSGSSDGAYPGSFLQAGDGNFYGTTAGGGAHSLGTVFKLTPSGTLTTLYAFSGTDGADPASLIQAGDGNFYGTTRYGANGWDPNSPSSGLGTVFKLTPSGTLTTLYAFSGTDGAGPKTSLLQARDGNLYGTTYSGGPGWNPNASNNGQGTIFKITTTGTFTTLYAFSGPDGDTPSCLIQAGDGNLYGTTFNGANGWNSNNQPSGLGTVFKLTPSGTLTTLYAFSGTDGATPSCLLQARDGNLYGTTFDGGPSWNPNSGDTGLGTVFKLTLSGTLTFSYHFDYSSVGKSPSSILQARNGDFYGTTSDGGSGDVFDGTIFWAAATAPPFDLDGDGNSDLLWQNQVTGDVMYTLMNGSTPTSSGYIFKGVDPHWQIVGTPDLNGDGYPDFLWQNQTTGQVAYALMRETTLLKWGSLFTGVAPGWQIVGTPDLNGDGSPDILWQNQQQGKVVYTLLHGTSVLSWGILLSGLDANYQLVGTADFNGDGYPDLLWQNQVTGDVVIAYLKGITPIGWYKLFSGADLHYRIAAELDLNKDGYADLLWQNQAAGNTVASWLANGQAISWAILMQGMGPDWRLVAPH